MTFRLPRVITPLLWVTASFVAAVGVVAVSDRIGATIAVMLVVAACAFAIMLVLPVDALPATALVLYLLVPRVLLATNDFTNTFTPSFVVLAVWFVRSQLSRRTNTSGQDAAGAVPVFLMVGTSIWVVISLMLNNHEATMAAWALDFIVLFLAPLLVRNTDRAVYMLGTTFLWSSGLMAAMCLIEFAFGRNVFLDPIYSAFDIPDVQHWSVYRAAGTLGHPLHAGLFFAMGFGLAFGRRFEGGGNRYLLFAGVNMLGVLLTVSRSSLGAVVVAAAAIIIPNLLFKSRLGTSTRISLSVLIVTATIALTQVSIFRDRLDSSEAAGSTEARNLLLDIAEQAASAHHWLGAGPGTALVAAAPFNFKGVIIENGYLQLLISLGVPGLLLVVLLLVGGALRAARRGAYAGLGVVVAYAVAIGFFNVLESSRPTLVLGGFALMLAWRSPGPAPMPSLDVHQPLTHRTVNA